MSEVLKKFGRYFLLDRVAQGGMAEIYRARLASTSGPSRLLVIKRIQQGYGANAEFLEMFRSETQVTMGFNHPNVVQVYDFGEEQDQPYIAMEFVDGKNLRQFLQRFNEIKQGFPIDLASFIIEQSASGLQYAHAFKDKISGEPLNIIHRDISPQNILISYEGNSKVIDFGIAKAATNSESTRAGIIKGKPSYLSPEQISGEHLDGRCDIFALGAVLWELLCGRKLFAGENDLAVLKMIEASSTHVKAPSTVNPEVPKELDYIVLKALAKHRDQRYQTAEEFRRALHKFVYSYNPDFNPGDLSYYAKDLFKDDIVEDRKKIQKLNEKAEQLLASGSDSTSAGQQNGGAAIELVAQSGGAKKKEETTTVFEARDSENPARTTATRGQKMDVDRGAAMQNSRNLRAANLKGPSPYGTGGASTSSNTPSGGSSGASPSRRPGQGSSADSKSIPRQFKPQSSSGGGAKPVIFVAAALAAAVYLGPMFGFRVPILSDIVHPEGPATGSLTLEGNAKGVEVKINDRLVATELPANFTDLPSGAPISIAVNGWSSGSYRSVVTLRRGEKKSVSVTLGGGTTQAVVGGSVASGNDPGRVNRGIPLRLNVLPVGPGTTVSINGKAVESSNGSFPVALDEPLELVIERPNYKTVKREFVLSSRDLSGRAEYSMEIQLEPQKFGFLTIRTTPSSDAFLSPRDGARTPSSDKPLVRHTPFENEKFPIGTYSVKLVNEVLGMEKVVTISVQEGKAVSVDERLEIKH